MNHTNMPAKEVLTAALVAITAFGGLLMGLEGVAEGGTRAAAKSLGSSS